MEIAWLKFAHVLGLVYWLGGDLGVFYLSFFVANAKIPSPTRVVLAKILFALDMAPRVCMIVMLPLGVHLGTRLGMLPLGTSALLALWLLAAAWLVLVFAIHAKGPAAGAWVHVDWTLRMGLIVGLVAAGLNGQSSGVIPTFLTLKLFIFAGLIASGLMIRRQLKPFGPAFASLVSGQSTPQDDQTIRSSLQKSRPFVLLIWIGLLASTALGLHAL